MLAARFSYWRFFRDRSVVVFQPLCIRVDRRLCCTGISGVSVIFLKFVKPKNVNEARERFGMAPLHEAEATNLPAVRAWMALVPYIIVVAVFAVCKLGIPTLLASTDIKIPFPGLAGNVLNAAGADPGTTYTLNSAF